MTSYVLARKSFGPILFNNFQVLSFSGNGPKKSEAQIQEGETMKSQGHRNRRYLTDKEVEEMTGLATSTLAKGRCWKTLKLPYIKVGKTVRYDIVDVEAFMAARRVDPASGESGGRSDVK